MEIVAAIAIYIAGLVTGIYAASQIETSINKNIKKKWKK
tara:strand:+ start:6891 stop:7007 length:117 start_codon:yes stop_codon:yes gene_type:complete